MCGLEICSLIATRESEPMWTQICCMDVVKILRSKLFYDPGMLIEGRKITTFSYMKCGQQLHSNTCTCSYSQFKLEVIIFGVTLTYGIPASYMARI